MDKMILIERELKSLGLLDKAREIYRGLGRNGALSYMKSSYPLLGKADQSDLSSGKGEKTKSSQPRFDNGGELIGQASDDELIRLLKKDLHREDERKKKILVVEDEFGLQETFRDVLRLEGYDVRVAVDGENGYQTFLEFMPDLVFTDVVMPMMSGIELVKKIRQQHPEIKVIYISGFFGLKNMKYDLNEEVFQYGYPCLSKPFKISVMLALIDEYIHT